MSCIHVSKLLHQISVQEFILLKDNKYYIAILALEISFHLMLIFSSTCTEGRLYN